MLDGVSVVNQRIDGTFNQTATIRINASSVLKGKNFTCIARGYAVRGMAKRTIELDVSVTGEK